MLLRSFWWGPKETRAVLGMGDKTPSPFSLHYSLFRFKPLHHSLMSASVSAECHSSSTVDPPSLIVFSGDLTFFPLFLASWVS